MKEASRDAITPKGFELEARRLGRLMRDQYRIGFIDVGGWDTHVNEGAAQGALANNVDSLGKGLAALAEELGGEWRAAGSTADASPGSSSWLAETRCRCLTHRHRAREPFRRAPMPRQNFRKAPMFTLRLVFVWPRLFWDSSRLNSSSSNRFVVRSW
jgi:Protein of unknown function (DUF1501)